MGEYQELIATLAFTLGVAWASGINLYAAVTVLGLSGVMGYIDLPPALELLQDPLIILAAAFMYCVEFMADKTPGVDTAWDALKKFPSRQVRCWPPEPIPHWRSLQVSSAERLAPPRTPPRRAAGC